MNNNEEIMLEIAKVLYDKSEVKVMGYEFIREPGSKQVRYYPDGSGDPGEPALNETFAEFSLMCETSILPKMGEITPEEFRDWVYRKAEHFRDSSRLKEETFEEMFSGTIHDLVRNFGTLPIEVAETEIYIDYIYTTDSTIEIKFTTYIVGDIYSY